MAEMSSEEVEAIVTKAERDRSSDGPLLRFAAREMIAAPELATVVDALSGLVLESRERPILEAELEGALRKAGFIPQLTRKRRNTDRVELIAGRVLVLGIIGRGRFETFHEAKIAATSSTHVGVVLASEHDFAFDSSIVGKPMRTVTIAVPSPDQEPTPPEMIAGRRHVRRMHAKAMKSRQITTEMVEVDDPRWSRAHHGAKANPRKIRSKRHVNESPLVLMEAKGTLTKAQSEAGTRFRMLYERVMRGTPSPSDLKERVDSSGAPDVMSVGRLQAGRELRKAAQLLGAAEYWLVRAVCGDGHSLRDIAVRTGIRRDSATTALRWSLDCLAEAWSLASRGSAGQSKAAH